jgi:hypothetical protein
MGPIPYRELGERSVTLPLVDDLLVDWEAAVIDRWWRQAGSPDPYTVVEVGAGDGSRARKLLALGPECLTALRYVLVEDSPVARDAQTHSLAIEQPAFLLGPVIPEDPDDGEPAQPMRGVGPLVTSLLEVPVMGGYGAVVAVGWLGRLPSDRIEWSDGSWHEVRLKAENDELVEILVPLDAERADRMDALVPRCSDRSDGARYALLEPAVDWLSRTVRVAEAGFLAVVDRWSPFTSPLPPGEVSPSLALDQLARVRGPLEALPAGLFSGLSVVTWALG